MKLGRNLLAGLANSVWTALVGLAVIPLYLKFLGIEAYGLIGFFATTQALLQILDLGLAPTINREVARCSAVGNLREAGKLLHTLAFVYWGMAGVIAIIVFALASFVAEYWLQASHVSRETVAHAVMLMGLVIACRWPIGLYQGALMGAQRLTVSSGISIGMVTLGNFGAVGVLAFVSPTIEAFFIWQAGVGLVYAATIRWAAWRVVGRTAEIRFDGNQLKRVLRFSIGMSGIALSSLVFTQLDKVLLSKILGLEEFGRYMLATAVVSALYVIISPTFNIMYPRFSALVASGDTEKLAESYRLGTRLLATVLFPIAMTLAIFAEDLVRLWTGNPDLASSVAPVIGALAIGSSLNGVMNFPYALQLAHGKTRLPLSINATLIVVVVPLIVFLAASYGALGGAIAWLVLNIVYVMIGTPVTHRHLLIGLGRQWLFEDVGIPLGVSLCVGLVGTYAIHEAGYPAHLRLVCAAVLVLVVLLLTLALSPQLRTAIWSFYRFRQVVE
jgi:O-antigen/teichoic acid export membrane protein